MTRKLDRTRASNDECLPARCWNRLRASTGDRNDPWRTPALASAGPGGPEVRTVVLRAVDPERRLLEFHTDVRSGKARQLTAGTDVAWMFYDASAKQQLRCRGPVQLHRQNTAALKAWEQLHQPSRAPYAQSSGPGEPWQEGSPVLPEPAAYANFLVVQCTIERMDWLQLGVAENVRVLMQTTDTGWVSQRVSP